MGSGKFSLKMCSKSGKFRTEIEILCRKPDLKMLLVRTDYVCRWTNQIAYPSHLLQMIVFSMDESVKSIVKLEGKSGKTLSIGCCSPPKLANSRTLDES